MGVVSEAMQGLPCRRSPNQRNRMKPIFSANTSFSSCEKLGLSEYMLRKERIKGIHNMSTKGPCSLASWNTNTSRSGVAGYLKYSSKERIVRIQPADQ
jgi:hypothetical protein